MGNDKSVTRITSKQQQWSTMAKESILCWVKWHEINEKNFETSEESKCALCKNGDKKKQQRACASCKWRRGKSSIKLAARMTELSASKKTE